jgi:glycerate dehydrogenase
LVKNIVNYSTNSVAQITLGLVLQLLNQIQYHDRYVKNGFYTQSNIFTHLAKPFSEIHNKRWGILGLGNIGKKVAEIAQAFGAEVVYHSISGEERKEIYQNISLEELLKTSDIISIHSPLNNKSKHLIGWKELNMMKKSAILVNTGRGGIVNEKDLAQALNENTIAGAGIDVYEQEPIPINNPLLSIKYMDKLVLSPHIAWASKEARSLALSKIYQHIDTFIQSKQ